GNRHPSIVPYETFRASDGWVNLAIGNDSQWRAFCAAVGEPLEKVVSDPRFATNVKRVENREALAERLEPLVASRAVAEWVARGGGGGVPCGPILTVAEALAHPQVDARGMVVPVEHATAGRVRVTGVPTRLSETPGAVRTPPPRLGEHTRAAL